MSHRGMVGVIPRPRTAPGADVWMKYAGHEYTVFIDESFFKFFDFNHKDGNFVHGAVGLPSVLYEAFKRAIAPAVDEYNKDLKKGNGVEPDELKSADLYKVDFRIRRRLMLKLNAALSAHGGFIAGFYTSNRGFVMEKIREDLLFEGGVEAVPEDHSDLYKAKVRMLNEAKAGPGVSGQISNLISLPILAMAYFLSALNSSFRVVYDPRQADEDIAVKNSVDSLMEVLSKIEMLRIKAKFLGLLIDRASHEEVGLQVADLVAAEVRRFFRFNPELLTFGSDLNLITSEHKDEERTMLADIEGKLHKTGREVRIPERLLKKALIANSDCALPYLRKLLASGLVTCITEHGTERDVALFEGFFLDLCD